MKTQRKHTRAVRFITDELVDADAIDAAPQADVDAYLEKNGIKVSQLDARLSKFAKSLDGRLAMTRGEKECELAKHRKDSPKDYSHLTEKELLDLINKAACGKDIPYPITHWQELPAPPNKAVMPSSRLSQPPPGPS